MCTIRILFKNLALHVNWCKFYSHTRMDNCIRFKCKKKNSNVKNSPERSFLFVDIIPYIAYTYVAYTHLLFGLPGNVRIR